MRYHGLGLELRVELAAEEPRMLVQLDNLHQVAIRRGAADRSARLFQWLTVGVVELVAMAVPLADLALTVGAQGESTFFSTQG